MAEKLTDSQINDHLKTVSAWTREGDTISRKFTLKSFPAALMFASTVGHLAEAADHHPDILIQWKHVTLTLSTHSAGGLTDKDFALAQQIDTLPMK
ncbi:MAG: 4a-hydroxytetrahydrobiopterin dehydratase [Anaerolineae bacterium]|jgi:4a-hydroxytetrahydrobiopterin dehydratase|nr:4a-hydroxytetrahydrobiopterin dehydratase [Anaerolineae bacterium]